MIGSVLRRLGFGSGGSQSERQTQPVRLFLCGNLRTDIYTERDIAAIRQAVFDARLLEDTSSRIYVETENPAEGIDEYVIIRWWRIISNDVSVKYRGQFDAALERVEAMRRLDDDRSNHYSLSYDVTAAVMAEPDR